jgi:hypothetical protein
MRRMVRELSGVHGHDRFGYEVNQLDGVEPIVGDLDGKSQGVDL